MLSRRAFITAAAGLTMAACAGSSNSRRLLWSEEFDSLDLASPSNPRGKWRPNDVWQPLDQGYADFATGQHSTWLANPAQQIPGIVSPFSVRNSVLSISCTRTPSQALALVNGCPWVGGMLISNTNLSSMVFGYGYYEFKARLPAPGKGMFPALWLYAARGKNPTAKSSAEIDVFEVFGQRTGKPWTSTLHQNGTSLSNTQVQSQSRDTTKWHTYGLDWSADHMDFYYDGLHTASAKGKSVSFYSGAKMAIRMNFVMDAKYFDAAHTSDALTPDTMSLDLDYIRKYDKP